MIPYDTILDTGATFSMIDNELCESLCLRVNSFKCNIPHCVVLEGVYMTKSITNIYNFGMGTSRIRHTNYGLYFGQIMGYQYYAQARCSFSLR